MSDLRTCELCGGALSQIGVLAGRCPHCMVDLALESESLLRSSDEPRLMQGRLLKHYQILSLIGAGGMGVVWKAKDTALGREVAIKILFDEELNGPLNRLARFEREAKLLASLNHPNIAAIHGLEEDADMRFLVLELVEGESLTDRLRHGAIPVDESLEIARQISSALEAAHERGIIHRDSKPANIKITGDGTVKVLDFGLAKTFAGDGVDAGPSVTPSLNKGLTEEGLVVGTPAYMAPEQASGKKVDRRADIWAFGVVLYEMVTGSCPFRGNDRTETMTSIVAKEPDLEKVPVSLRRLLRKSLEKDPRNRLRDIGDAWELLIDPAKPDTLREPVRHYATLPWIAASLLGVAALLFFSPRLKPRLLPNVARFYIEAPPGSRLPLGAPAISNDGRKLAYTVVDSDGMTRVYVRAIDRLETTALPGTEGAVHPFWLSGEDSLAFVARHTLRRIDLSGRSLRDLMDTTASWQATFNQYGDIVAPAEQGLVRMSSQGGTPTPILGSSGTTFPAFLDDGQRFLVRVSDDHGSSIQLARLGSTERTVVVDNVFSAPILAPTPGGRTYLLFLAESNLMAQEFDEVKGKLLGSRSLLIPHIGRVALPAVRPAVGISPAGILAYQKADQVMTRRLTWVNRSGQPVHSLPPEALVLGPRISPDQLSVAGVRLLDGPDAWVINLMRESSERKTFNQTLKNTIAWSTMALTWRFRERRVEFTPSMLSRAASLNC